jgi:hypothetical protein
LREQIEQIKRMHQWVVDAEHILDGSWGVSSEESGFSTDRNENSRVTNKEVGIRFDMFLENLGQRLVKEEMSQTERECLTEFLRVLTNLRPNLIQCYDLINFPRTNNEMEGAIRKLKTRYRRISGRKNWNTYLLRHGRDVAFFEWWSANPERWQNFERLAKNMDREYWKQMKQETLSARSEQLNRFRFLHRREAFLTSLEERWAAASKTAALH